MSKDRITKIKELAQGYLYLCSSWIQKKATTQEGSALKEVLAVDVPAIEQYIKDNKNFSNRVSMAQARLEGEDITKVPSFVMGSLYDCTFDEKDFKAIGENDGMLKVAENIFSTLNMRKKSQECIAWMYNADI